jgi:hypothetical protein
MRWHYCRARNTVLGGGSSGSTAVPVNRPLANVPASVAPSLVVTGSLEKVLDTFSGVAGHPARDEAAREHVGCPCRRAPRARDLPRLVATAHHGNATIGHLTSNADENERHAARAVEIRERIVTLAPASWQDAVELVQAKSLGDTRAQGEPLRLERLLASLPE